jgi:hypothetical protein
MSICLDEEVYIYPEFFKGTTSVDYQMATFVLSRENNVTMQELMANTQSKRQAESEYQAKQLQSVDIHCEP